MDVEMERGAFIGVALLVPMLLVASSPVILGDVAGSMERAGVKFGLLAPEVVPKSKRTTDKSADGYTGDEPKLLLRGSDADRSERSQLMIINGVTYDEDGVAVGKAYGDVEPKLSDRSAASRGVTTGREADGASVDSGGTQFTRSADDVAQITQAVDDLGWDAELELKVFPDAINARRTPDDVERVTTSIAAMTWDDAAKAKVFPLAMKSSRTGTDVAKVNEMVDGLDWDAALEQKAWPTVLASTRSVKDLQTMLDGIAKLGYTPEQKLKLLQQQLAADTDAAGSGSADTPAY